MGLVQPPTRLVFFLLLFWDVSKKHRNIDGVMGSYLGMRTVAPNWHFLGWKNLNINVAPTVLGKGVGVPTQIKVSWSSTGGDMLDAKTNHCTLEGIIWFMFVFPSCVFFLFWLLQTVYIKGLPLRKWKCLLKENHFKRKGSASNRHFWGENC